MPVHIAPPGAAPEANDRLIPFAEARKIVGVSRSKIYLLLEESAFPKPVKVGRSNYFSEREIQQWISDRLDLREVKSEGVKQ